MALQPRSSPLAALVSELASFFGAEEAHGLLRRAGRRFGAIRRAAGRAEDAGAPVPVHPLPAPAAGGHQLPAGTDPATVEWWAGFLEGISRDGAAVLVQETERGWLLAPDPSGRPPDEGRDFRLPPSGALAPYQMAQVADLSADAILFVDRQRRIRGWNRGAERMFGYTAEEAVGSYFDLLVPQDLRDGGELESIARRTEESGEVRDYVTRRRTRDGRELTVSLSRTLIQNRQGEIAGYGVILRDITESQRIKEELDRAAPLAAVGQLASQVAHEVRNPLAGIHGALQILRRRLQPAPEDEEVFSAVQDEIARLDRLVTDLMRFGRPAPPHLETVDLAGWLREWRERIGREAEQRGCRLELGPLQAARVRLDPVLFETILRNLFENAMEAATDHCRFHVELVREAKHARLLVRDNGPGIPEELRERVLLPFFTTKARGSGLGLAICARHLRDMGGALEVLPAAAGALLAVDLPLSPPAEPGQSASPYFSTR